MLLNLEVPVPQQTKLKFYFFLKFKISKISKIKFSQNNIIILACYFKINLEITVRLEMGCFFGWKHLLIMDILRGQLVLLPAIANFCKNNVFVS
jgi:hypothetical protein